MIKQAKFKIYVSGKNHLSENIKCKCKPLKCDICKNGLIHSEKNRLKCDNCSFQKEQ